VKTRFLPAAVLLASLAAFTPQLQAQQSSSEDQAVAVGLCGNDVWNLTVEDGQRAVEQTRLQNPALYQRMVQQSKTGARASLATVGDKRDFYVVNQETHMIEEVPATLRYHGIRGKIWVEDAIASQVTATKLAQMAKGIDSTTPRTSRDSTKGIIQNDIDVFGNPPTPPDDDGYFHFLILDIKDGLSGGAYIAGYFFSYDQRDPATNYGSNGVNMLYIDVQGIGSVPGMLNTMAHEFQHNIHYNTNPDSETFFNEGCSEEASLLNGYATRRNTAYRANTNVPMLRWTTAQQDPTGAQILSDYERAMTFTHYMREQFGEQYLTELNLVRRSGMARVDSALRRIGSDKTWREALRGFAVTNYVVKDYADSQFIYTDPILATYSNGSVTGSPSASRIGTELANYVGGNYPASGSLDLAPYGIGYLVYNTPAGGGLRSTFNWSGSDAAVYAIMYRNKTVIDVRELGNGEVSDISDWPIYTKIVYVLVNLKASRTATTTVTWAQEQLVASVNSRTDANALAISTIAPNPAHQSAVVEFTAPRGGEVEFEVFDAMGASVLQQTVVADAGRASVAVPTATLPSGPYIVRVRQGGASVTRALVVTH